MWNSHVLNLFLAFAFMEWKCNSNSVGHLSTSNSSESSLVKAMEGGPVQINSVFEETKETKSKITPRKGVNISSTTLPDDFPKRETPNLDRNSKEKLENDVQESFTNMSKEPLLKSTNSAFNVTTNLTVSSTLTTLQQLTPTSTEQIVVKKKKKPLFTMIVEDELLKDMDSFIESPTTGRDYVLPIVLFILLFPAVIFMIKLIYKRGTEFTERQQYHRMYLIDGMYNTR